MKRFRAKAIGLGFTLLTGPLHAADPPAAPPNLLPAGVRSEWATASSSDVPAVWLPARRPPTPAVQPQPMQPPAVAVSLPIIPVPQPTPEVVPAVRLEAEPPPVPAPGDAAGPRAGTTGGYGPLPEIPALPAIPAAPPAPPLPVAPPTPRPVEDRDWRPIPEPTRPAEPPTIPLSLNPVPQPPPREVAARPPADIPPYPTPAAMPTFAPPGDPLPPPREVPRVPTVNPPATPPKPAEYELPTAPPHLMVPAGVPVPGKHGSFGSPGIRLSRDYPPLSEVLHHGHGRDLAYDDAGSGATDRLDFRAEYLLWWVRSQSIPALATTTVAPGDPNSGSLAGVGFLGDPATRVLLGPGTFGGTLRGGLRLRAGYWFDDCGTWGVDGSYFFLGRKSASTTLAAFPVLTRPIFAPNLNAEFGEVVSFPGVAQGSLVVDATSFLWGADANVRHAFWKTCDGRLEAFAGYRFLSLNERLRMTEFITALPGNATDPTGTRVVVQDRFQTRNSFHGGQLGLAGERNWGAFSLDGRASVALGNTHQVLDITGAQTRLRPGMANPAAFAGGLLATGPNLGQFSRDRFGVVPEATVNFGYRVTPSLKLYAGYNFLYWSNVLRPGDQIDRVVDLTYVPNPPANATFSGVNRPQPTFNSSSLWVHGIQFGIEGRW